MEMNEHGHINSNKSGDAGSAAAAAYHSVHALAAGRLFRVANHEDRDGADRTGAMAEGSHRP